MAKQQRPGLLDVLRRNWWAIPLTLIILASMGGIVAATCYYVRQFGTDKYVRSGSPADWGVFGDYFGGVVNPLLALINIAVTVWLTILINRYATTNLNIQLSTEREIAKLQLKHDALKEFRSKINRDFEKWMADSHSQELARACRQTLTELAQHYDYLFNLTRIESYRNLDNILHVTIARMEANDLAESLASCMQASGARHVLISELGQSIVE